MNEAEESEENTQGAEVGEDRSNEIRQAIAETCVEIHTSVSKTSDKFYHELRRRFYTTPKSYLDLINLYISLVAEKRQETTLARDRLINGLLKLEETNTIVDTMQVELIELQPLLKEKGEATAKLLEQVSLCGIGFDSLSFFFYRVT